MSLSHCHVPLSHHHVLCFHWNVPLPHHQILLSHWIVHLCQHQLFLSHWRYKRQELHCLTFYTSLQITWNTGVTVCITFHTRRCSFQCDFAQMKILPITPLSSWDLWPLTLHNINARWCWTTPSGSSHFFRGLNSRRRRRTPFSSQGVLLFVRCRNMIYSLNIHDSHLKLCLYNTYMFLKAKSVHKLFVFSYKLQYTLQVYMGRR